MEWRKDIDAMVTIDTIKELLMKVGIDTHIVFKANPMPQIYSCRVELRELPGIGTNGKGISEMAALASAYSELMERLQNRILTESLYMGFDHEGHMEEDGLSQEMVKQTESYLCDRTNNEMRFRQGIKTISRGDKILFKNISTGEHVYLDKKLLNHYLGSNGMCAGNSYEEAVSQGLCEIMERYVLRELYLGKISDSDVGVIPRKYYKQFRIFDLIKELEESGYICRVLNCSLGGRFPVAGFVMVNPNTLKAKFSLGCDYDLEIALQRCITELFQGRNNIIEFRYSMQDIFDTVLSEKTHYFNALREWQGTIPKAILTERVKDSIFPFTQVHTSREAYKLCMASLGKQYDILICDTSFLGFPTYRIIVRGLSNVSTDAEEYQQYNHSITAAMRIAKQLSCEHTFQLEDMRCFAAVRNCSRYKYFSVYDLMGIVLEQPLLVSDFDEQLAQLCYFQGEYALAYHYQQRKKSKQDIVRSQVIYAKMCGWDDQQIDNLLHSVASTYNMETLIHTWMLNGLRQFPRCPDCMTCDLRSKCAYEGYKRIKNRLDVAYSNWREGR